MTDETNNEPVTQELNKTSAYPSVLLSSFTGLLFAGVLGFYVPPVVSIGFGALTTIVILRRRADRDYALAGAILLIGFGGLIFVLSFSDGLPAFSDSYQGITQYALLGVGSLYMVFYIFKAVVKLLVKTVGRRFFQTDTLSEVWDVGVSLWSLAYIVWNVIQFTERVARSIIITVLTPGSAIASLVASGWLFDVATALFIVCVMLFFHTLATWHSASKLRDNVSPGAKRAISSVNNRVDTFKRKTPRNEEKEAD